MCSKTTAELLGVLLAALVGIVIEGEKDGALAFEQLTKLAVVKVGSRRSGHVVEARLPQHSIVEQSFDQDHFRIMPDAFPVI
jgi:hypothetical protein